MAWSIEGGKRLRHSRLNRQADAAGKQAVLTFDNAGLLGIRITEAMLQDELGADPAVLNSCLIQALGNRVNCA